MVKKNLEAGTKYVFRVRAAVPTVSPWTEPLAVTTVGSSPDSYSSSDSSSSSTATTTKNNSSNNPFSFGAEGDGDGSEGFAASWARVQASFEAGAPEKELRAMLEKVAEE